MRNRDCGKCGSPGFLRNMVEIEARIIVVSQGNDRGGALPQAERYRIAG